MKLNPQQAPLYGECVLTVQLNNDDLSHAEGKEPEEEVEFYLLFSGSTQRHVTSTLRVSRVTLQAVCPAHNVCEQVLVTLCWARPDQPVDTRSQETFCFIQDLALDMARFLLDSTAPQEALLLDDTQIPLKECKKLDESLALALKHLSLPHHSTARTHAQTDVGSRMNHQTRAVAATDAHTHSDTHGSSSGTQKEPLSILLDRCSAVQRGHHLSSLLHLAASHGLRMVAMFLLQQDGSLEALRWTNAQGQTAADVAESRGHKHLVELFTQYEATGDVQLKPKKEQLHLYPEGKVFQRHTDLGTYTLTLLGQRQSEGGADGREEHGLQEEVEELRRLIQLHRDTKGKSNSAGIREVSPGCGLQLCANEQQENRQDAGLALVTTTTTDEQGSPLSLEDQTQGEDPAVVTRASCASALLCQSQEARGGRRGAAAVNPPAAQNRKNKKRNAKTTRRATESAGKRNTPKTGRGTAQGETKTTGSGPESEAPAEAFVQVVDGGDKKAQQSSSTEETPLPIKPVSPPGEVGAHMGKKVVALPTTSIAEKQEREEWEVKLLICGQATETKTVTASPSAREEHLTSPVEFCLPHHTIVTMGQEQSQSPQETQTDQEEPSRAVFSWRTSPTCPDSEQKNTLLWQDGTWTGSQEGSPSHGREGLTKTVWFQSGDLGLGASEDSNRKEVNSRSVWYCSDKMEEEKHESIKVAEGDLNTPHACGLTSPQLLEHGLSSCQLCTALSQPHAVGAQPAPSHGPAAQRREVHESQPEKEVGPDWKEEGVEGGKEEVSKTETSCSRKSSETTDIEERGEEKPKSEEKGGKGRKKRRPKKGRGRGSKPKLSSSSSVESKGQSESRGEQATSLSLQLESGAKKQTLRSQAAPEPAKREDAAENLMQLPRQTEEDTAGPVCDPPHSQATYTSPINHGKRDPIVVTSSQTLNTNDSSEDENTTVCGQDGFNPDSVTTASGLDEMDIMEVDDEDIMTMQLFGKEAFEPSQLQSKMAASLVPQTMANGGSGELSIVDKASVNQTGLLESKYPEELFSNSKETKEHLCPVVSSEPSVQHDVAQSLDLNKPKQRESEAASLPCEGTALQIQEGSTEALARGRLMHNGTLTDRQREEENRHGLLAGGVEEGENTVWKKRKSEENDCGLVHGRESSSARQGKMVEDDRFPSLDVDKTLNHDRNLVATAVAVVTVAIASAVVSIELSQQSASKDVRNDVPLVRDAELSTDPCRRLPEHVSSVTRSTQLTNKDKPSAVLPTDALTEEANSVQLGIETETAQLCHEEQEDVSLSNNIATAQNKLSQLCSAGGFYTKPVPEAHESATACADSRPRMLTESQLPCPVMDTGQDPKDNDQDAFLCLTESTKSPLLSSQLQEEELQAGDGSLHVGGEEGKQRHERLEKTGGSEGTMDVSDSNCRTEEHESEPQVLKTPLEEESRTSTLPVAPCDPTPVADNGPGELIVPLTLQTSEYQAVQSQVDVNPTVAMVQSKDRGSAIVGDMDGVSDEDHMDVVDGWKERERNKEAEKTVTVKDTSVTEAESFPVAQDESELTSRDLDCTQIERKRDVFYPVQPCPQQSPVAAYADIHPDREASLPVCLLHSDNDRQKADTKLDDGVFKRPDPPPCVERGGRGASNSVSSAEDALKLGTPSPSEGIWSVGAAHPVDTQSCRLSWQSEPEVQGRDKAMGEGGEEEEKKDQLPENPVASAILRVSIRSMSPFRRHSWEPVRNNAAAEITRRSSFNNLLGELKRPKPPLHRRSVSWCPSNLHHPHQEQTDNRSYSLEGLEVQRVGFQTQCPRLADQDERTAGRSLHLDSHERGSLVSLTEEEQEGDGSSIDSQTSHHPVLSVTTSCPAMFHPNHQHLTKTMSVVPISHYDVEESSSFSSASGSVDCSITEEDPGPLRSDTEGKGGPKIRRTFSYIRSKMIKKGKDKEKERRGEKEQEGKEREKKSATGHVFVPVSPPLSTACQHCTKPLHNKDTFHCNNCGLHVHKSCRESVSVCAKSKVKQQPQVPEVSPGSAGNSRTKSTSSASSISSSSSSSSRERWSTATSPDDQIALMFPRRHPSIFNPHSNLSKSISTSNIAGLDDGPLKGLKFLSQSTEALHPGNKVNASTESLPDEGCPITHVHTNDTEVVDNQLMEEFECDVKDLEADSWSSTVDKKFLKTLKKDEIKRQDVIYELYQTEFHHVRTLKIMSEVYAKGLQKEVQLETDALEKIFPVLDDLLHIHTELLIKLLETKRASSGHQGQNGNTFFICHIGDILVNQFSDSSADRMKKAYGRFCSRHHEAVNLYKDLLAKDKRFQAFIKKTMSSSIVRRLSIPECILLVTQRITKYPVLIQRILQHTKDSDADHSDVCESLRCVKELISAVDSKVNEHDKKRRLREVHSRTDSKSIMRMKSGQMFAKEDLIRGRKLLHDGAVQLKNTAGRLKDVQAMLLSDVLVFLQEKDQKYVFASLDQRSTVISLQNLIVREVANEERGLFLITAGTDRPEMVEVLASSKEERNVWMAIIQDAMHCMEKDDDDGVPSETEEDRKQQENRAKEIRELLRRKDEQIVSLLEEKVLIFKDLSTCNPAPEDTNPPVRQRMLFRATPEYVTKGEPIITDALTELENLRDLVNTGVGGAGCSVPPGLTGGGVGPVCLPRRAETFGGFDSHQMNSSKNGEKEEADESLDLRRTESDSVLKKGATASLQMLLKRNNGLHDSVTHLHNLLVSLQAVVVQQDSFVEDQRQALEDRLSTISSKHSSSSSLSSLSSSRPSSLIEQEKHRSLEIQRQEAASLQKQQASHQEEKRRKEKEWELKEKYLAEREKRLVEEEEETRRRNHELLEEREMLQRRKEEYQREMEWLRDAQRRLERDEEALRRDAEKLEAVRKDKLDMFQKFQRTSSSNSEDSKRCHSSESLDLDLKDASDEPKEVELSSSAPTKEPFLRIGSKRMGKNFNPFSLSSSSKAQGAEKSQESQLSSKLLQLAKPKEKKDKKKKGKKEEQTHTENKVTVMSDAQNDEDIFFC